MAISAQPVALASKCIPRVAVLDELARIREAAEKIASTLDLDLLIDHVVNEVARSFGCTQTSILLRDFAANDMVLVGTRGCRGKGTHLKIGKEGMVGWVAATAQPRYAPDVRKDPFYIECEPGTLSELDIPLMVRDQVIGVFSATWPELDACTLEQRQLLEVLAGHIAIAIENARLFQLKRLEHQRMLSDAEEAREIQQALFPKSPLFVPGFAMQGLCTPAGAVGGDWYDFIQLPDSRWGVVLADVSGKGMAAALLMSATRRLVRSLAETISSPGELLARVNASIRDEIPSDRYITMIYGVLDPERRMFTFANAGHPMPLLVDHSGARNLTTRDGFPLGLMPGNYSEQTITLAPDFRLLFYSDGISEASDGIEDYGTERLTSFLSRPDPCLDVLLNDVRAFSRGSLADDATVVLVRAQQLP